MLLIVEMTIYQRNSKDLDVVPLPSANQTAEISQVVLIKFLFSLVKSALWIPNPVLRKSGIRPLLGSKTPKFL